MCAQCKRETLPDRRRPGLVSDMHRAPTDGMVKAPAPLDPEAAKVKRRKDKKRSLRSLTREVGIAGAIVLSLDARQVARFQRLPTTIDENCQRCLARRRVA